MSLRSPKSCFPFWYILLTASLLCADLQGQNVSRAVKPSLVNIPRSSSTLLTGTPQRPIHERFATFRAGEFQSVLLLQNIRPDVSITVTPSLIVGSGEFSMDPVNVQPQSATTVDIGAFLQAHGLTDKMGTAVIRYTFSPYEALNGFVLSSDVSDRLYVNSYAQSPEEYWQGTSYDATLWAPDPDTQGSISIINTTQKQQTVHVTFQVKGRSEEQAPITIPARHTQTLNISNLVARSRETGVGIHVEYSEYPGDIVAEGHLVNQRTGFEKYIHFLDKTLRYPTGTVRAQTLLLGQQPAEDGFPAHISFRSVAVVHNIDSAPVQVTPTLRYERAGSPQTVTLKLVSLGVGETSIIDLSEQQKAGLIPADFRQGSLKLDPGTDHASIVAELSNFDERTGGYTIGPLFSAYPSRGTQSIWRTDGNFQTTIMVENTAAQDDAVVLRVFSNSGTYTKTFPISGGNLLKIDLKQLQQENVRGDNGSTLPGTYGLLSVTGKHGHLSKLSFDKLIHSTTDSDYVGDPGGYCDDIQSVSLFLEGNENPFQVWEEWDWYDGTVEQFQATGTSSGNTQLMQITNNQSGDTANLIPIDGQSHTVAFFGQPVLVQDCPACSADDQTPAGEATVPPCANPANFTQTSCTDIGNGTLEFTYTWGSSTGSLSDVVDSGCTMGEIVMYPGNANPFQPPSPPWPKNSPFTNPTVRDVTGGAGSLIDDHQMPSLLFVTPFSQSDFTATQNYRYRCACGPNANQYVPVLGPLSIVRSISQNSDKSWKFTVTKSGCTATLSPI